MTWADAVRIAMTMTATTGDKWSVEPAGEGWVVVGHGPYDPPGPPGKPAAAIYFERTAA